MADFRSIAAVGRSIEQLLNAVFTDGDPPVPGKTTRAALVTSDDLDRGAGGGFSTGSAGMSIFLYRIAPNGAMRAAWSAVGHVDGRSHLPVDLHYLLTAWAENADWEHAILGKAMQCLEDTPIISGPLLAPTADWAPNESVQVTIDDVGTETLLRIFDSIEGDFRLSVPYVARVIRIDGARARPSPPATTVVTGFVPEVAG
jgi:hypothetical protein